LKPTIKIAETLTPDGKRMVLCEHDGDFSIALDGREVMTSREYESELELARLGCDRIKERRRPKVLIGGLGLGYTLRETLELLGPEAKVVVAELLPEVVRWNREYLGQLTGHPLRDGRVVVETRDVQAVMRESEGVFDAIMLDVDNGPNAMTHGENAKLYGGEGIRQAMRALRKDGCLAIWSVTVDPAFEKRLRREGLHVRRFRVRAYKGSKSRSRCVWVASRVRGSLPVRDDRGG
jgi:spermidine synthase